MKQIFTFDVSIYFITFFMLNPLKVSKISFSFFPPDKAKYHRTHNRSSSLEGNGREQTDGENYMCRPAQE